LYSPYKKGINGVFSSQWSLLVLRLSSSSQQETGVGRCWLCWAALWENSVMFCALPDHSNHFLPKDSYSPQWYLI